MGHPKRWKHFHILCIKLTANKIDSNWLLQIDYYKIDCYSQNLFSWFCFSNVVYHMIRARFSQRAPHILNYWIINSRQIQHLWWKSVCVRTHGLIHTYTNIGRWPQCKPEAACCSIYCITLDSIIECMYTKWKWSKFKEQNMPIIIFVLFSV